MQDDSGLNPWLNRRILCIGAKVGAGGNNRSVLIVSGDNSDFVMTVDAEEQLISGALDFVVFRRISAVKKKPGCGSNCRLEPQF